MSVREREREGVTQRDLAVEYLSLLIRLGLFFPWFWAISTEWGRDKRSYNKGVAWGYKVLILCVYF